MILADYSDGVEMAFRLLLLLLLLFSNSDSLRLYTL